MPASRGTGFHAVAQTARRESVADVVGSIPSHPGKERSSAGARRVSKRAESTSPAGTSWRVTQQSLGIRGLPNHRSP